MVEGSARTPIPAAPLWLGLAGLIPFWGLAIALVFAPVTGLGAATLAFALAAYAAVILSFLGGIRWGLATRAEGPGSAYAVAVLPSLVAWAALALPDPWRLLALGAVALALGPFDATLVKAGVAPPWFARLRLILSTGAGTALCVAALWAPHP